MQTLLLNQFYANTLIPIMFAIVCALGARALHAIHDKLKDSAYVVLLDKLDKLATIVVLELDQTVVMPAKRDATDGKLPAAIADDAMNRAVERFRQLLGEKGQSKLGAAFGDVARTIESLIEAKVRELRLLQTGRKIK